MPSLCFAAPVSLTRCAIPVRPATSSLHARGAPQVPRRRTRPVAVSLDAPRERRTKADSSGSTIDVKRVIETPGGFIVDTEAFHRSKKTKHTVIVGKEMISDLCTGLPTEVPADKIVEFALRFLMSKGQSLTNTEGMQDSDVFPVNYFSMRQIFYFYPEAHEKIANVCKNFVEAN